MTSGAFDIYEITWIVIGCILAIKLVVAIIYLCFCRKRCLGSRNRNANGNQQCPPYPADVPPSYDDVVKTGVINQSYISSTPNLAAPVSQTTPEQASTSNQFADSAYIPDESNIYGNPPPIYHPPTPKSTHLPRSNEGQVVQTVNSAQDKDNSSAVVIDDHVVVNMPENQSD